MYSRLAARKRVVALWDQRRLTSDGYEGWAVLRFGPRLRGSLNPVLVLMD